MKPSATHLALAIKAANDAYLFRFKHGAIIYDKRGTIVSVGFNKRRSSTVLARYGYYNCWHHAESDAIIKALRGGADLRGCSLLVVRIGKNKLCNSRPCAHCMALILDVGIDDVWFSDCDGEIQEMML